MLNSGIVPIVAEKADNFELVESIKQLQNVTGFLGSAFSVETINGQDTLIFQGAIRLEDSEDIIRLEDILGNDGQDGFNGRDGEDGAPGPGRFAGQFEEFTGIQSEIIERFISVAGREPVFGDVFSQIRNSDNAVFSLFFDSSEWIDTPLLFIDGNLVATGTIAGDRLVADTEIIGPSFKSQNYVPDKSGVFIDGQTGFAEFEDIKARGDIEATSLKADVVMVDTFNLGAGTITSMVFGQGPNVVFEDLGHGVNSMTVVPDTPVDLPENSTGVVVALSFLAIVLRGDGSNIGVRVFRNNFKLTEFVNWFFIDRRRTLSFQIFDSSPGKDPTYRLEVFHPGLGGNPDNDTWIILPSLTIIGGKR